MNTAIMTEMAESALADCALDSGRQVLWCFSQSEMINFFGDCEIIDQLKGNPAFTWVESPLSEARWRETVLRVRPEVVLGAWSMPMLDDDLVRECQSIRYLCYFCGSIRAKVSRRFIECGGLVTNWGAIAADTVAECALMLILAALRRTTRYALEMHVDKIWQRNHPLPLSLYGRRVGVHGVGAVARKLGQLLKSFDCKVEYWSEGVPQGVYDSYALHRSTGLRELFAGNDIVVEAEALTPKLTHSIDDTIVQAMRPGSVLVNVGRGGVFAPGVVDRLAVRGDVAIGLDVYEVEPLPEDSVLRGMRHVTLLPHVAGPTIDQYRICREHAFNNLRTYINGGIPHSVITPEEYDRAT